MENYNKLSGDIPSDLNPPTIPKQLTPIFDNIPLELRERNQWVNWKFGFREDGKLAKVPRNSKTGKYAQTNNKDTWSPFEVAKKALLNGGDYDGIGFVFSKEDGFFGIDVDHCFEDDKSKTAIAKEILAKFKGTYAEISPSGNGLRIFGKGKLPFESGKGKKRQGKAHNWIEAYDYTSPRYLTVTGHHHPESSTDLTDCKEAIEWLRDEFFTNEPTTVNNQPVAPVASPVKSNPSVTSLSANEVIEHCRKADNRDKFEALWSGGGDSDKSSGDMALCSMLAFYSKDDSVIDAAFRQSARMRDKWDVVHSSGGETYGQMTVRKAIDNSALSYDPNFRSGKSFSKRSNAPKKDWVLPNNHTPDTHLDGLQDWTKELRYNDKGKLTSTPQNAFLILKNDERWQGVIYWNQFSLQIEKKLNPPYSQGEIGEWSDFDDDKTWVWLDEYYGCNFKPPVVSKVVSIVAREQEFHPVKDYLNSLTWDKTPRLNDFFSDYFGTEKSNYTSMVAKVLFLSAVARIFNPGCKADYIPILEGKQGIGKSSAIRALVPNPKYFRDTPIVIGTDNAFRSLRGKWIVELAELGSMKKADVDHAKAFFSSQVDEYHKLYTEFENKIPRQSIFIGTVNRDTYLQDETGNRRYLPIKTTTVDIEGITEMRDQLWAEAVYRLNQGEPWWPDNSIADEMREQQEARYDQDVWQSKIGEYLCTHNEVTIEDVATSHQCLGLELNKVDRRTEIRIGKIIKCLGYSKHRVRINGILKNTYRKD